MIRSETLLLSETNTNNELSHETARCALTPGPEEAPPSALPAHPVGTP